MKSFKKTSWLMIAFGLAISILVVTSTPAFIVKVNEDEDAQQKDQDAGDDHQEFITTNSLASPLTIEINIDPQLFLLATIPNIEEVDLPELFLSTQKLIVSKEIRVLLRRIISPNAP